MAMVLHLLSLLLCILGNIAAVTSNEAEWEDSLKAHDSPLRIIPNRVHSLPSRSRHDQLPKPRMTKLDLNHVSCKKCHYGVDFFLNDLKRNLTFDQMKEHFLDKCTWLAGKTVCSGLFDNYGPTLITAFIQSNLDAVEICYLILGEKCEAVDIPQHRWKLTLPDIEKPEVLEQPLPLPGLPNFKILHISDIHFDPYYRQGSVSNCREPLCCRNSSTKSTLTDYSSAGRFGSYNTCDSPRALIVNFYEHIAEVHPDIDFILWTGDLNGHDVWDQTVENHVSVIEDMVQLMAEYFPTAPIFPAIGNHESVPAGTFAPPWVDEEFSISWLYEKVANEWKRWLPVTSGCQILKGGFYSVLIREKFRLISLNTNFCHALNWWLLVNSTDPARQLEWLINELQEAESNDEKIIIIGHTAPGSEDCLKSWSSNYYDIVNRYESTIVAQFFGHSHADEFKVYTERGRATNVAYIAPSLSTHNSFNPAYRIYYLDGDHSETTRELLDHETWTMDLEEANQIGIPNWYRLYSAIDAFEMKSLRPQEWANVIYGLENSDELFSLFYKFYTRNSRKSPLCITASCRDKIICDLKTGKSHSRSKLCGK